MPSSEGEKIKPFLPNPANPDEPDVLAIGELMQAAGADFAAVCYLFVIYTNIMVD